jgi:hypothetical protein
MPDQLDQHVARVAGETIALHVRMAERPGIAVATTGATITASFETVKHLLSNRPLRRPNRVRPRDEN